MKIKLIISVCLLLILCVGSVNASIDVYDFSDESMREDFVALTKELRCPKCQNQDIADSNAPIASDMRKEVHRLLEEGQDRDSIVNHMIERFGDFVTYNPKKSSETFFLWYGPWLLILLGLIVIATLLKRNKSEDQTAAENQEELNSLLKKYDRNK